MLGIPYNTLIVLIGVSLLGASAGLVGCFATLRRRALTGDALAHAALPGVCLAFLVWGERSLPAMLSGAFITGMLGILIIAFLRKTTRVKEDAAIGIVLSVFFGAGVVLVRFIQNRSTTGSKAGLDSYILGKTAGIIAQDVYLIAGVSLISLLVILLLYKEFKLIAFDPDFAQVQGWPALTLDLLLMALIALAVVIGLPAVGVVMIAALLIIPSVAARFWTDRLLTMLLLSLAIGFTMGLIGTWISSQYRLLPAGPIIVLVGTGLFVLSLIVSPRRGLIGRWVAHLRFRRELEERKLLRVLYDLTEPGLPDRRPVPLPDIRRSRSWTPAELRRLVDAACRDDIIERGTDDSYRLTEAGLQRAAEVARGARLWELFLTEYADIASGMANLAEESVESLLPAAIVDDLNARLERAGRLPRVGNTSPLSPVLGGEGSGVRG